MSGRTALASKRRLRVVPTSMQLWGYCRVSTDRQSEKGLSLDDQERRVRGRALELGRELAGVFIERGVSGSIPFKDRPEGGKLWRTAVAGDTILAPKLDRTFRDAEDCLATVRQLKDRMISLVLLDIGEVTGDDPTARLFMTMLAAFSEWERNRIKTRILEAKEHGKATGRYLGGMVPYGYQVTVQDDGKGILIEDREQQEKIARIIALRETGTPLRQIVAAVPGVTLKIVRNVCDRASGGEDA